jgi:anaerobic ribonucleoside-triphosphate reductase activating protein
MRINHILPRSQANGPGIRFTLWTQGCNTHCAGCSNKDTWDPKGGTEISCESLRKKIIDVFNGDLSQNYSGITITGGEPLDQVKEIYKLCHDLRFYLKENQTIFLTTGYTLDEIRKRGMLEILDIVDILCTGPFEQDKTCSGEWKGSSNQKIHFLSSAGYEQLQMPIIFKEIYVKKNGDSMITGFSQ